MPLSPRHHHPDSDSTPSSSSGSTPEEVDSDAHSELEDAEFLSSFGKGGGIGTEWYSPEPEGYQRGRTRFVVVIGTVMSGLGKGIFSSSLAKLLQDKGLTVAPIKMEGYLNIDSGTLNPYRHGEVFVLDDGLETDMDLGTYERLLHQDLTRRNYITAGQIYTEVLDRERRGGYLGRDVQMIPHVTGSVKYKLRELAMHGGRDGGPADVVFVEVGGTAGDYENGFYIEALRELAFEEGPGSTCFVALTYIIEPQILGEQKSKAAQLGIKRLMEAGIQPNLVACRAKSPVTETVMEKIGMFSNVPMTRIFSMHDRSSVYLIPEEMRKAGLDREILSMLNLHDRVDPVHEDEARHRWSDFAVRLQSDRKRRIVLGIPGKYAALRDAYASIDKAIEHAGIHLACDIETSWIDTAEIGRADDPDSVLADLDAMIIPGGFGVRGVDEKIQCIRFARERRIPFLGICLGFQTAVLEYARNVLGLEGANSTEFLPDAEHALISELPDQKKLEGIMGGTMRLGAQDVVLRPGSLASFLHGGETIIHERFRHRYEVDPAYITRLEESGLIFSGRHPEHPIMQVLELPRDKHPYFIAAQYHPELTSRPLAPQPLFMGLVAAAIARLDEGFPDSPAGRRWVRQENGCTAPA